MLLPALRRLAVALVLVIGLTVAGSLLIGALAGASLDRALTLGFYLMGCFLMVAGFFVGNRGPARPKSETPSTAAPLLGVFSSRRMRWATLGEQNETINSSAVFVSLGAILIALGLLVDTRHSLF